MRHTVLDTGPGLGLTMPYMQSERPTPVRAEWPLMLLLLARNLSDNAPGGGGGGGGGERECMAHSVEFQLTRIAAPAPIAVVQLTI